MAQYHLKTRGNCLSRSVIAPGAQGRVETIADQLDAVDYWINRKRGHISITGRYPLNANPEDQIEISAAATGMGSASAAGIIFDEIVASVKPGSGPDEPIDIYRQGSGGSLVPGSNPGDVMVIDRALSWDGTSLVWEGDPKRRRDGLLALANEDYYNPALLEWANPFLAQSLWATAQELAEDRCYLGIEATTADFADEQGREREGFELPDHLVKRHQEAIQRRIISGYSMEASALFRKALYVSRYGVNVRAVAINTIYAQRLDGRFVAGGDELATKILLETIYRVKTGRKAITA